MGYSTPYQEQAQLGDFATEIVDALTNARQTAADIQTGTQQLAQKLINAGNVAVRISNTATGAAAGAKAGATAGAATPVQNPFAALAQLPKPVLYGGGALLVWLLLRR